MSPRSGVILTASRRKKCATDLLAASWTVGYTLAIGLALLQVIEEQQHVPGLFPPELGPDLMPARAIEYSHRLSSPRLLRQNAALNNLRAYFLIFASRCLASLCVIRLHLSNLFCPRSVRPLQDAQTSPRSRSEDSKPPVRQRPGSAPACPYRARSPLPALRREHALLRAFREFPSLPDAPPS